MKNLSLRSKVLVALAPLVVILVAMAVLATVLMNSLRADTVEINEHWLPSVQVVGALNTATSDYRIADGAHVMSTNDADMARAEQDMAAVATKIAELRKTYESLISSESERRVYETFSAEWAKYIGAHDKMIEFSRQNLNQEAADIFRNGSRQSFDAASNALAELIRINDEGAAAAGKHAEEIFVQALVIFGIATIVALVVSIALGTMLIQAISPPVKGITDVMRQLTGGNLNVAVVGAERKDELGEMAAAVQVFKDSMIETERLRSEQLAEQKRQLDRAQRISASISSFEKSIGEVVQVVAAAASELQSTAQAMSGAAEETASQSNAVAAASEQMSQNVQTVSAATEELTSSIREIERQVAESSRLVSGAVNRATETAEQVRQLTEASAKIEGVIDIINNIASQTTLLALNATMEAARAGEAGRGFAVVASEVKSLASQTGRSTEEISSVVREIRGAIDKAAESIGLISVAVGQVNVAGNGIASAVVQQGSATQEIARNVEEAARGTQEVSSNITGVTEAASHTGAAATQVLAAASELARNGEVLRFQVASFLSEVRAA